MNEIGNFEMEGIPGISGASELTDILDSTNWGCSVQKEVGAKLSHFQNRLVVSRKYREHFGRLATNVAITAVVILCDTIFKIDSFEGPECCRDLNHRRIVDVDVFIR